MPHSKYLDPQLADGLQLMQALTGDNDITQDLPAARAAANARDETLLANMDVPDSLAQSVETARAGDGHDIEMRIMQPKATAKNRFSIGCMVAAMCWDRPNRVTCLQCAPLRWVVLPPR